MKQCEKLNRILKALYEHQNSYLKAEQLFKYADLPFDVNEAQYLIKLITNFGHITPSKTLAGEEFQITDEGIIFYNSSDYCKEESIEKKLNKRTLRQTSFNVVFKILKQY